MDDRSPHLLQLFMENRHFGFVTKFPQKNTDDDHNSSIQKKKTKTKTKNLNSTQLRASQLHPRAQFCNTVASDGCRTLECVEKNHLLPSPDILLALVLRRFLFVGVGGWVVIFFLFFPHCSL